MKLLTFLWIASAILWISPPASAESSSSPLPAGNSITTSYATQTPVASPSGPVAPRSLSPKPTGVADDSVRTTERSGVADDSIRPAPTLENTAPRQQPNSNVINNPQGNY